MKQSSVEHPCIRSGASELTVDDNVRTQDKNVSIETFSYQFDRSEEIRVVCEYDRSIKTLFKRVKQ